MLGRRSSPFINGGHMAPNACVGVRINVQHRSYRMIEVSVDPERKLVRAVLSGFLTVEEVERFSREEQEAVRAMGLGSGEFVLLVETSDSVAQTQEVVDCFQRLMVSSPLKARRIATVRSGALPTMQMRRITAIRGYAEVFETVEEAEAWLLS